MKRILLLILLLLTRAAVFAQDAGAVRGKLLDREEGGAVEGATVAVKGTTLMVSTNEEGVFVLRGVSPGPVLLVISHVGYEGLELSVKSGPGAGETTIYLDKVKRPGKEVVVSASRRPEKITEAPASIQVIGTRSLEQFAGSNVAELVSRVQGVEYNRSGVDEITFNARGLNSAFNNKVFQLVDGRNTMAAASAGLALFNNGSTNKEDIEKIEIVLGPQSALYGPNAHNALFNYITKDPRRYPGTTLATSVGSQHQFSTRFRHAFQVNSRWAYKLTGEQASGRDYEWFDSVYAGSATGTPFGPALAIPERIRDFSFRRYRGEAHVYYRVRPRADLILSGGGSQFTRLQVTTSGRNHLREVTYGFLQARLVHPRYFVTVYNTWGNLGRSLLLGNYTRDFWNRTHSSLTTGPNRYLPPDSAELFASRLGNTVKERSHRLNADAQYNYSFQQAGLQLVAGISYQLDRPNGYGITLIDSFQKISITQYGAVMQLDKSLPWQLRLLATARWDHHSNFGNFLAPRFALLKQFGEGNFRITWGRAYAMPSIQAQYAGINRFLFGNGAGIYYIPNGVNVRNAAAFSTTVPLKPEQVSTWEAGYKGTLGKKLFVDLSYYHGLSRNFISPARSVGGRVLTVNGIAVSHNPVFAGTVVADTLRNASFSTFFNYGEVRAYGLDAGLTYTINDFLRLGLRYSWFGSDITEDDPRNDANKDNLVSDEERSLNAPRHRGLIFVGVQNLLKGRFFANLSVRYVEQYDFYSGSQIGTSTGKGRRGRVGTQLKNFDWGPLGGFTTVDLDLGYRFSEFVAMNAGITNLFDTRQVEMVGSPSIGRLLMVELRLQLPQGHKKAP